MVLTKQWRVPSAIITSFGVQLSGVNEQQFAILLDVPLLSVALLLTSEKQADERAKRPVKKSGWNPVVLGEGYPPPFVERVL